ncbi:MAG TPA: hypothetical protein VNX01_04485 [Bacteroidia bacterium]|jgi:hypothetical protein|nr:hypothetical protein [Bacteroidia bacterium]
MMVESEKSINEKRDIYSEEQKALFIEQFKELILTSPKEVYDEFNRKPDIIFKPLQDIPTIPITFKFEGKLKEDYLSLVDRLIKGEMLI